MLGALLAELANQLILARLYPAFHLGLSAWVLLTLPFAAEGLQRALGPKPSAAGSRAGSRAHAITVGVWVLAALLVLPSAHRLARFDNFRFVVSEHAPLAGRGVEFATLVVPVAAEDTVECDALSAAERAAHASCQAASAEQTGRTLDLRQRDFLLISVRCAARRPPGQLWLPRPTTPHIDALAKDAVVFEHAYAPHAAHFVFGHLADDRQVHAPTATAGRRAGLGHLGRAVSNLWLSHRGVLSAGGVLHRSGPLSELSRYVLGFEYRWVEFAEGPRRVQQLQAYLATAPDEKRLFTWVHLFAPHEPYENHPEFCVRRSAIWIATIQKCASQTRPWANWCAHFARRPNSVVILTADHGEEFGEHGGHYHGTSVYEEQIRVPLIISAPGSLHARRIAEPVQSIDLLPTLLSALDIPKPPRLRVVIWARFWPGKRGEGPGLVLAETDEQTLLGEGTLRLVCGAQIGRVQTLRFGERPRTSSAISRPSPRKCSASCARA